MEKNTKTSIIQGGRWGMLQLETKVESSVYRLQNMKDAYVYYRSVELCNSFHFLFHY